MRRHARHAPARHKAIVHPILDLSRQKRDMANGVNTFSSEMIGRQPPRAKQLTRIVRQFATRAATLSGRRDEQEPGEAI